ncbi:MAG: BamA/TamA family outer membrane protein [Acidobacteriota bacterium]|nr:BamA/TamA family outer membrane protein [Acidobacteriota bacterium]
MLLGSLLCGGALLAHAQQPFTRIVAEDNVNSRYIVENVELAGDPMTGLSRGLRDSLQSLIGERFNAEELQALALQLRKELHLKSVTPHVTRGSMSDQVKVIFEVKRRSVTFDISVPKFLYHSKQGWSAQAVASTTIARNHNVSFGIVSDGDELTERFAGIATRYENTHVGSDRVRFAFQFESYHEQWNRSTLDALSNTLGIAGQAGNPSLYRTRKNYQPTVAFALAKALTLTVGAGFEQMGSQTPDSRTPAVRSEAANAFIAALRYRRRTEDNDASPRDFAASYELRAATKALGGDYIYSRHRFAARYALTHDKHTISDDFTAGYIAGRAPLFERFVLGTSSLLRGWNRYAIDPLGGNRLVHNSVTYGYRFPEGVAEIFYDAGALWNRTQNASARHSLGVGFRQSIFSVAVAFPVREGRIDPIFMVGMNY